MSLLNSWFTPTTQALGLLAQNKLLKRYVRSPFEVKSSAALNYIVVKGKAKTDDKIQPWNRKERVLVLMHGFGLGLGFFYENYDTLGTHFDKIIAVDWPGMGCSSRTATKFTPTANICSDAEREKEIAQAVTDELIDSLEKLRVEENIPHFTLAGHSLGGYLAGKYAVKYPDVVDNLVLISPVGIPEPPPSETHLLPKDMSWQIRMIEQLWKWNFTPQGIVRIMGTRGQKMVKDVVSRRFGHRWEGEELDLISEYMYHITAAPGSGEYTLSALLEPIFQKVADPEVAEEEVAKNTAALSGATVDTSGAVTAGATKPATRRTNEKSARQARSGVYAKLPLEKELGQLKMPILLVYGDNDWLYYPTADQSVQKWKDAGVPAAALGIVSNAGHHLYLDNSREFNRTLIQWVENTEHLQVARK